MDGRPVALALGVHSAARRSPPGTVAALPFVAAD